MKLSRSGDLEKWPILGGDLPVVAPMVLGPYVSTLTNYFHLKISRFIPAKIKYFFR